MMRIPVATGNSSAATRQCAMSERSCTCTRCETSSASDSDTTNSAGMPSRWVTTRAMSTASLAMRSMALTTWSTEDMPSASRGRRAALTQTARMSCTRSLIRSSRSRTSVAISGSPK